MRCGWEHLWKVKLGKRSRFGEGRHADNWRVLSLREIAFFSGYQPIPVKRAVIPVPKVIAFDRRPIPLDPYLLGVLIGDGGMSRNAVTLSTADQEILQSVAPRLPEGIRVVAIKCSCIDFRLAVKLGMRNPLVHALRELDLMGKTSANKFVPDVYRFNSANIRLEMLRGLMDTDGSVYTDGTMEFSTISTRLADDVDFLARSLGAKVKSSIRQTHYTYNGERRAGKTSFRLRIRLPYIVPFRLTRKVERCFAPVSTCDYRVLFRIETADKILGSARAPH